MKNRITKPAAFLLMAGMLWSCGANSDQSYKEEPGGYTSAPKDEVSEVEMSSDAYAAPAMDSIAGNSVPDAARVTTADGFITSSAARMNPDSSKIFILTASMRYEVKDVRNSTLQTEAVIGHFGGWVSHTNLRSEITNTIVTPVSEDSSLEEKHFTVVNDMTLRVPIGNLDTTLKVLSRMIEFLDYRVINAEDVGLKMQFEKLKEKRNMEYNKRLGGLVDEKGKKLNSIVDAERERMNAQQRADDALMRQLEMKDQVLYSTISLQIYQRETVRRTLIPNYKNIDAYRPGFFSRLGDALEAGWRGFLNLIIGFMHVWPLWAIIGGLIGTWVFIRRRNKKRSQG